jgi:hypothetical protein
MTFEPTETNKKQWIIENLYYISVYFITTGSLYLWGYWSHFSINILEYLDITDIIKVTAFPIAVYAGFIIIATFIAEVGNPAILNFFDRDLPDPDEPRTFSNHIFILFFVLFLLAVVLIAYYEDMYWQALSFTLGLLTSYIAYRIGVLKNQFGDRRKIIVLIIVSLPFLSWGLGTQKAYHLTTGRKYSYLISDFSKNYPALKEGAKLRYIGSAGEKIFLYNPVEGSTIIAKPNDEMALELKQFERLTPLGEYLVELEKRKTPPPR